MKFRIIILCFSCLSSLVGCTKDGQFFIGYTSHVTIPSTFGQLLPFSLNTPEITSNAENEFSTNKTAKNRISSIRLNELTLKILSPEAETFSFLNDLEVYISAEGLNEEKIAYNTNIPDNVGNEIICNTIDADLQAFIKKDKFKIRTVFTTDETLAQNVEIEIKPRFLVKAKIKK